MLRSVCSYQATVSNREEEQLKDEKRICQSSRSVDGRGTNPPLWAIYSSIILVTCNNTLVEYNYHCGYWQIWRTFRMAPVQLAGRPIRRFDWSAKNILLSCQGAWTLAAVVTACSRSMYEKALGWSFLRVSFEPHRLAKLEPLAQSFSSRFRTRLFSRPHILTFFFPAQRLRSPASDPAPGPLTGIVLINKNLHQTNFTHTPATCLSLPKSNRALQIAPTPTPPQPIPSDRSWNRHFTKVY